MSKVIDIIDSSAPIRPNLPPRQQLPIAEADRGRWINYVKLPSVWDETQNSDRFWDFLDATSSPSTYPCQCSGSVSEWVIHSFRLELVLYQIFDETDSDCRIATEGNIQKLLKKNTTKQQPWQKNIINQKNAFFETIFRIKCFSLVPSFDFCYLEILALILFLWRWERGRWRPTKSLLKKEQTNWHLSKHFSKFLFHHVNTKQRIPHP